MSPKLAFHIIILSSLSLFRLQTLPWKSKTVKTAKCLTMPTPFCNMHQPLLSHTLQKKQIRLATQNDRPSIGCSMKHLRSLHISS
uniref:Putative secreted protein n=1 Tax=Ixodes ricinus TaxID=34613 RepID=A0A6B0U400_IXORI